jgi:hypothetical protein
MACNIASTCNCCKSAAVAYMLLLLLLPAGYLRMSTDICDIKVTPTALAGLSCAAYGSTMNTIVEEGATPSGIGSFVQMGIGSLIRSGVQITAHTA